MIATILEPGNRMIEWSSRKLYLYSRQGFSFSLELNPTPPASPLHLAVARPSLLSDSRRFMLPPPSLQQYYRGKKPWHSKKCKRTNRHKFSPEKENTKNKILQGRNETVVEIQYHKTQQIRWIEVWRGGWMWSGLCDVAAAVTWTLWFALAWVQ